MITGEKNRTHNRLTISNRKLDNLFGKSSHSIMEQILQHPKETFDATPFVNGRYKTPINEIQIAIGIAVSREQTIKLRHCLDYTDKMDKQKQK